MKFVICECDDTHPLENGSIVSTGIVGLIDKDNSFFTMSANFGNGKRPKDLNIGEVISSVEFSSNRTSSFYDVYRVR